MAKPEKKKWARELRREGMSILAIAKKVGAAKSSVSGWCRDIKLTPEQEEALQKSNARREAQVKGARANVIKHRQKRLQYQEEGRQKAREGSQLHLAGCMLYWAEGAKARNEIKFVNSDADMMVLFVRFMRESLQVPDNRLKVRINVYLGNGLSPEEIIDYWLNLLDLTEDHLNKSRFNAQPKSSKQTKRNLVYGTCELYMSSTRYIQHIYGAIQEYAGIEKPKWLDL